MSGNATSLPPESSSRKSRIVLAAQKHTFFMIRLALLLLTFVGAVAYNDYGSPGSWFSDELTWVTAGMLVSGDLNPHFFAYPAGLQIYGTFVFYKLLNVFSYHPAVINMFLLNGVARTLSAVFFVSGVALFERSVAYLGQRREDLFTLVVFATSCAMIHHAHIGTAQSSLFFAVALVTYSTARCIIVRNLKFYYVVVFCCGVAIGTKYTGIYLSVCLPFLYFWSLKSFKFLSIIVNIVFTMIVGFVGSAIFNPFLVIDHQAFVNDVFMVAVKEAPMFVSPSSGIEFHASMAYYYLSAFFGPLARVIVIAIDLLALTFAVAVLCRARIRREEDLCNMAMMICISTATLLAYFYLEVSINISQSRYYIPIGLTLAVIMCIGFKLIIAFLRRSGRDWKGMLVIRAVQASGWLVAASCVALGIAYVLVFPLSGHVEAFQAMAGTLKAKPTERVAQLSLHTRTAVRFQKGVCAGRCFTIINGYTGSDIDVSNMSSWGEYFDNLDDRLREINADLLAVEDVFFYWTFMIPKGDHDYSDRFKMQNPGPQSFDVAFRNAGYTLKEIVPRIDPRLMAFDPVISDAFDNAAEGVGGSIYIFQQRPFPP